MFALQQQQQMMGELEARRGAEPAQRQEPAPCLAFNCLPPCTAKTSGGRQIKGCITEKQHPGGSVFSFSSSAHSSSSALGL